MGTSESVTAEGLAYEAHPGLFQAADAASLRGQRAYLRAVRTRLILSVLAAVSAAITVQVGFTDIAAVCTALLFVSALAVGFSILHGRPNEIWYSGRALAESVKTLTWRYAVGGAPFPLDLPPEKADLRFLDRLSALRADLSVVRIAPSRAPAITERMRELRAAPLEVRRQAYLTDRVQDQQLWYGEKAVFHRRRAGLYQTLMLLLEIGGVAGALAKAFGLVSFDLAGIVAACIAAFAAWTATRQHTTTADAYSVAGHDLGLVRERFRDDADEAGWAEAVGDAEAAISREHSTWRSSHGE